MLRNWCLCAAWCHRCFLRASLLEVLMASSLCFPALLSYPGAMLAVVWSCGRQTHRHICRVGGVGCAMSDSSLLPCLLCAAVTAALSHLVRLGLVSAVRCRSFFWYFLNTRNDFIYYSLSCKILWLTDMSSPMF